MKFMQLLTSMRYISPSQDLNGDMSHVYAEALFHITLTSDSGKDCMAERHSSL